MCEQGSFEMLKVPEYDQNTREYIWSEQKIDTCLANLVQILNDGGLFTKSCCCGHGKFKGTLVLQNGKILFIDQSYYSQTNQ